MNIKEYLLKNPIDRSKQSPYDEAAKNLGVDKEIVRRVWRTLRKQGLVEQEEFCNANSQYREEWTELKDGKYIKHNQKNNEYEEQRRADGSVQIKDTVDRKLTDNELFERYGRNREEWKIISVWFKDKANGFLLSVHFAPIKIDTDLKSQKELILEEIKKASVALIESSLNFKSEQDCLESNTYAYSGDIPIIDFEEFSGCAFGEIKKKFLYEIAIPDLHIGKLAWGKEVGEDYDINIAIDRYKSSIETLLSRVDTTKINKFLLPIGNDMLNVDNNASTTTAGTPQIGDSRFGKMFLTAKNLLISTIDRLSEIAPVDVVVVAGNHDNLNMFTLGEVISAWYHNNKDVTVDNSPTQRKYFQYGNTGIQFTHGNQEKHLELGLIFATEQPKLWADTKFRFCQLGHYHHSKKTQYVSVQENQGFQVQILPSLSGTDAWHYGKGYNSLKQAKAFLIHYEDGIVGEFTHTV